MEVKGSGTNLLAKQRTRFLSPGSFLAHRTESLENTVDDVIGAVEADCLSLNAVYH